MSRREIVGVVVAALLAALAWGGGSLVNLFERVSSVEAEQRGAVRWMQSVDGRLERIEDALRR